MDEELCRREETGRVVRALCGLESPYRDVVILRIYGQLPFAEIAALFAYSNLADVMTVRPFLECLRNKDYEGAFEFFDIERMYFAATTAKTGQNMFDFTNYFQATIGAERYYLSSWYNFESYTDYSDEGKGAKIWAQVIRDNAAEYGGSPIPKAEFAEAAAIVEEETCEKIDIVTFDSDLKDTGYTYIEFVASDGETYYMPTRDGRANNPD